jgi:DHA1 family inner membrane transport protein
VLPSSEMSQGQVARFGRSEILFVGVLCITESVVITGTEMTTYLIPAISRLFNVPEETVVLVRTILALSGLSVFLFGPLVDRYGRRPFLLSGLTLFAVGNIACAAAPSLWFLLAFQSVIGVSYAVLVFVVLTAYVGDVFAYEVRGRAMGILYFAPSLALIAGVPAVLFMADRFTMRYAFAAEAGLTLVALGLSSITLPRGHFWSKKDDSAVPHPATVHVYTTVLRQKGVAASLLAQFLSAMLPTGVFIFVATWLQDTFSLTDAQLSGASLAAGIGGLAGAALAAVGVDRLGKKRAVLVGMVFTALLAAALSWSGTVWLALSLLGVFAAGLGFSTPPFFALLTELKPESRATLLSLVGVVTSVGTGLTPLIVRTLWPMGGYKLVAAIAGVAGLSAAGTVGLFVPEQEVSISENGAA